MDSVTTHVVSLRLTIILFAVAGFRFEVIFKFLKEEFSNRANSESWTGGRIYRLMFILVMDNTCI